MFVFIRYLLGIVLQEACKKMGKAPNLKSEHKSSRHIGPLHQFCLFVWRNNIKGFF